MSSMDTVCVQSCMNQTMVTSAMTIQAMGTGMDVTDKVEAMVTCVVQKGCIRNERRLLVPELEDGDERARFLCADHGGCGDSPTLISCGELAIQTLLSSTFTPPSEGNFIYNVKETSLSDRADIYENSFFGPVLGPLCSGGGGRSLQGRDPPVEDDVPDMTSMQTHRNLAEDIIITQAGPFPIGDQENDLFAQRSVTIDINSKCQRIKDVDAGFTLFAYIAPFVRVSLQAPQQEDASRPMVMLRNYLEIFWFWLNPIVNDDDVFQSVTEESFQNFISLFLGEYPPFPEGFYLPVEPLARFENLNPNGQWTLIVESLFAMPAGLEEFVLDFGLSIICADECHEEDEDACGSCGKCVEGTCVEDSEVFCSNQCDQCVDVNKDEFDVAASYECLARSCPAQCNVATGSRMLATTISECGPCGMCDGNGKCVENIDFDCGGCDVCVDVNDGSESLTVTPTFACIERYCPTPKAYDPYGSHGGYYHAPAPEYSDGKNPKAYDPYGSFGGGYQAPETPVTPVTPEKPMEHGANPYQTAPYPYYGTSHGGSGKGKK